MIFWAEAPLVFQDAVISLVKTKDILVGPSKNKSNKPHRTLVVRTKGLQKNRKNVMNSYPRVTETGDGARRGREKEEKRTISYLSLIRFG